MAVATTTQPPLDLELTNAVLGTYEPEKVVAWSAEQFGAGLVMSSSFGADRVSAPNPPCCSTWRRGCCPISAS
jgi:hypothetical protein